MFPISMPAHPRLILASLCLLAACASYDEEFAVVEPVVEEAAVALVPESPAERARFDASRAPAPKSGVLTAGEIDDTLNLAAFKRYQARAGKALGLKGLNLNRPIRLKLVSSDGRPQPGARFTLRKPGAAEPFYEGYSGVNGLATIFPAALGAGTVTKAELRVFPEQGPAQNVVLSAGQTLHRVTVSDTGPWRPDFLDLVFVVDTTGSMGDELAWLTKELTTLTRSVLRSHPDIDLRLGLVTYRDKGDDYVLRNFGFAKSTREMRQWLRAQTASGGGDYPEAAAQALAAAADLPWRRGKGERLLIHIADAPTHRADAQDYLRAARDASLEGVQLFTLGASGVGAEAEFLMRQAAAVSNGRYLFLTDDSGVGLAHGEPTVSCYQVTRLTGLMSRLLRSELSGQRIAPAPKDVIRTVGSYDRGVCRD